MISILTFLTGMALVLFGVGTLSIPAAAILGGLVLVWISAQGDTQGADA